MSQPKLVSFTKFPYLANELQDLIWEWSLKDRPPAAHFGQLGRHNSQPLAPQQVSGEGEGTFPRQEFIEDLK